MKTAILPLLLAAAMEACAAEIHWTEAQSPITLTKDFEVPPGDTLVIEAGVFVSSDTKRFVVPYEGSAVHVMGSTSKPVSLVNVGIDAYRLGNKVLLESLQMHSGWLQVWGGSSYGNRLEAINCSFDATELHIMVGTNSIRGCIFKASPVSCNVDTTSSVTIENNLFTGWSPGQQALNFSPYDLSKLPTVRWNTFLDVALPVIRCGTLDISQNYWGTTNPEIIADRITDRADTFSLPGYATFMPFLMEPHPNTPTPPGPAAPPETPTIAVSKAIKLAFQSEQLVYYQVEGSEDMQIWRPTTAGTILGDGSMIVRYFDTTAGFRFYRARASREP